MARLIILDKATDGKIIDQFIVDLFEDEHIKITQSLKKIQDLTGVFSEFTHEFTVPATAKNNKSFKHYYQIDIIQPDDSTGINPHKEIPAIMILEDTREIVGVIEMRGVQYEKEEPLSYTIVFYGELGSVKAQLENINLNDSTSIDLTAFEFTYNKANIQATWDTPGKVLIPVQATDIFYKYDLKEKTVEGKYDPANIAAFPLDAPVNRGGGVRWSHLKPSYHLLEFVKTILEQVNYEENNKYAVEFDSKIGSFLEKAYFGPSVQEGGIKGYQPAQNTLFQVTRSNWQWGVVGGYQKFDFDASVYDDANAFDLTTDQMTCKVDGSYSFGLHFETRGPLHIAKIKVKLSIDRNGTVIDHEQISKLVKISNRKEYIEWDHIELRAGDVVTWLLNFNPSPAVNYSIKNNVLTVRSAPPIMQNITYDAHQFFPNMSAYTFISAFLSTFNLLLLPETHTTGKKLRIVDVESYYDAGLANLKDWTKYVDITNISSRKIEVPRSISLKFKKGEDFRNSQFYKINGRDFGEFTFDMDTDFGSEQQKQESIFTVMHPDKMTLTDAGVQSNKLINVPMTYQFNEEGNPINTSFWLFFYSGLKECDRYWFQSGTDVNGNDAFEEKVLMPMTQSWRNDKVGLQAAQNDRFLSFSNEAFDPIYENNTPEKDPVFINHVFENFFSSWFQRKYDSNTRKIVFNGNLPIGEYERFKLNDRILIDGKYYIIPEIKYDMLDETIELTAVTYDSEFELTKLLSINNKKVADVTVCRGAVCRGAITAASESWLRSYKLRRDGTNIVRSITGNYSLQNQNQITSGPVEDSGSGYHQYVIDIPIAVTPIAIGDVMAFYTKAWRKADSSREERTAQGAVVKIDGTKYTLIRFGDINVDSHGYNLNTWYWLAPDGTYTHDRPAKLAQLLFYVYDANTLQFNIEQPITQIEEKLGWVHIGEQPDIGWTFTPTTINAFEELKILTPHFVAANVRNFTLEPTTNRIKVDFPVRPDEPVFVQISIMVALSLESGSTRNIEIAHGVDGRVDSTTDWYNQLYGTNLPALGVYIPITYNWSGQVPNGHTISIFIRTEIREQILGLAKSIQVTGQI